MSLIWVIRSVNTAEYPGWAMSGGPSTRGSVRQIRSPDPKHLDGSAGVSERFNSLVPRLGVANWDLRQKVSSGRLAVDTSPTNSSQTVHYL